MPILRSCQARSEEFSGAPLGITTMTSGSSTSGSRFKSLRQIRIIQTVDDIVIPGRGARNYVFKGRAIIVAAEFGSWVWECGRVNGEWEKGIHPKLILVPGLVRHPSEGQTAFLLRH
ncbi:hypothetical protein V2G26_011045 [Clonostachys chloroleuca]